ncbi:MAG: hypothetical protein EU533_00010 [Promethearchaeota archaeon]|nr:MAG: hypothetical protein EU533_00010 [Candidatus Lokiarchaeota archaeon]
MAKFLTTSETTGKIEKLIREAKEELTLITPFLKLTQNFQERLIDADKRGCPINIVYGKVELNPKDLEIIQKLTNLNLYYYDNLHAKCYFNEELMVITSMNLHEFSLVNNREIGVLIKRRKDEDKEVYEAARNEALSIMRSSVKEIKTSKLSKLETKKGLYQKHGYCVRCKSEIDFNIEKPLCKACYLVWIKFSEPYYQEQYCHKCGRESPTSFAHPLCRECWQEIS